MLSWGGWGADLTFAPQQTSAGWPAKLQATVWEVSVDQGRPGTAVAYETIKKLAAQRQISTMGRPEALQMLQRAQTHGTLFKILLYSTLGIGIGTQGASYAMNLDVVQANATLKKSITGAAGGAVILLTIVQQFAKSNLPSTPPELQALIIDRQLEIPSTGAATGVVFSSPVANPQPFTVTIP